ncbi:hypothetical protein HELRODRAFT_171707 [Helobdella robusta]|uniref:Uncharacterized protein n=1 Tax=Helobdella robusta TaxID=6412 RepID=T1F4K7_HELRO|nr:hypothetical protein HELRODRAFT_171707 [Helobdella robusta]ESO05333.1 hypothetical protein HELRODRAFT_171707 [Helobdella robusta]
MSQLSKRGLLHIAQAMHASRAMHQHTKPNLKDLNKRASDVVDHLGFIKVDAISCYPTLKKDNNGDRPDDSQSPTSFRHCVDAKFSDLVSRENFWPEHMRTHQKKNSKNSIPIRRVSQLTALGAMFCSFITSNTFVTP